MALCYKECYQDSVGGSIVLSVGCVDSLDAGKRYFVIVKKKVLQIELLHISAAGLARRPHPTHLPCFPWLDFVNLNSTGTNILCTYWHGLITTTPAIFELTK